jgi:hypothetical protein
VGGTLTINGRAYTGRRPTKQLTGTRIERQRFDQSVMCTRRPATAGAHRFVNGDQAWPDPSKAGSATDHGQCGTDETIHRQVLRFTADTVSPATALQALTGRPTLPFSAERIAGSTSNRGGWTWKAVLGPISASGVYTAPTRAGGTEYNHGRPAIRIPVQGRSRPTVYG